jgi:cyclic pyranopterin phosphate synthase
MSSAGGITCAAKCVIWEVEALNEPKELTHVDKSGHARMVDVGGKPDTERVAVAKGEITMRPETLALIQEGGIPKGDVLAVAQVAGIMAAKRTHELIPLCHPLFLTHVAVEFVPHEADNLIEITATVKTTGKTGVEMESLTAIAVAALAIYDLCKAVDRAMHITNIRLVRKSGGKSGEIILE